MRIENFKEKAEGYQPNILFSTVGVAPYKIVEAWTEDMFNGDWCAISRFKYGGYHLIDRVPPEFIVELRFHNSQQVFECMMYLRKNGHSIEAMGVDKKDVRTMDGWIRQVNKLIKIADENILD
jgi:hypothetical protein